jgi:hypothetical protein
MSLHSTSIMESMAAGTIPIVSDVVGTSVYVTDEDTGIVLRGGWPEEGRTDIVLDRYGRSQKLDDFLVEQMTSRADALLDEHGLYWHMHRRAIACAQDRFSGQSFAQEFWNSVSDLYAQFRSPVVSGRRGSDLPERSLCECTVQSGGWAGMFESPSQPMLRIKTEFGTVWEMGGAMIHIYGNPRIELNDWSVLARYCKVDAPQGTYAATIEGLQGKYLHPPGGRREGVRRQLVRGISKMLRPFPILYHYAARVLAVYRRHGGLKFVRLPIQPEIELVRQGVNGYNIIRHRDRYYAILQCEGEFSPETAEAGGYSLCHRGHSVDEVLRTIAASTAASMSFPGKEYDESPQVIVEGFHHFNIVRQGDAFYAVMQSGGECARSHLPSEQHVPSFSGLSLEEVQRKILEEVTASPAWLQAWTGSVDSVEASRRGTR